MAVGKWIPACIAGGALLLLVGGAFYIAVTPVTLGMQEIEINGTVIQAEVADTEEARVQGLSGRSGLPESGGMLFVFESERLWGIWMKDMRFPIDILWADAQGRIVTIRPSVSPDSYPEIFLPSTPARYVLEVPAGFTAQHGIAEGDMIVL